MGTNIDISAIVPVGHRYADPEALALEYLGALESTGRSFELVYVLDGSIPGAAEALISVAKSDRRVRIIQLARNFGEAAAITAGFAHTSGSVIVTLPAYYQIEPTEIQKLIDAVPDCQMAVGMRWPRAASSRFETIRRRAFHWLVKVVSGDSFSDLGCGARAMTRDVLEQVPIYGDQHRFMPLLALRRGFPVREIQVKQSSRDRYEQGYEAKIYLRRLLDIFTVVFLVRFTKKPLRFFGMVGGITFFLGTVFLLYVVVERLFFDVSLADRPALLLSSLLVVLGMQILGLGLLGELIIFTHAQEMKEYTIEEIVN